MAETKWVDNLSHSVFNAADEYFDLYCTPCNKRNFSKEAVKYCPICKEYFCVSCVNNHNSFKVLSKHVLVDPTATQSTLSQYGGNVHFVPTELCKKHPLEVINMYCAGEDSVGCSVCFTLDHKFCGDIHYIPEYIKSNFPTKQVQQINKDLTETISAMTKLKTQHDRMDGTLDKSKATCKQEIQKYRAEINQVIDTIEIATLAELDANHRDTKQMTSATNQYIHDVHDQLIRYRSEIESDQSNDAQKFVIAKLIPILIRQCQDLQSEVPNEQPNKITFTRNTNIMTFLLDIFELGILSPPVMQDSLQTATTSCQQPQQAQFTSPSAVTTSRQQPQQTLFTRPFAVTTRSKQPQQSTGPSAATTSGHQPQQSTCPSAATTHSQQPQQSTSPSMATTSSQQLHQSTSPSMATTSSQQLQQFTSPSAATTSSRKPLQTQSTSPPAVTSSTSPQSSATSSNQQMSDQILRAHQQLRQRTQICDSRGNINDPLRRHNSTLDNTPLKQGLFKTVDQTKHNIKEQEDINTIAIWSSCIVKDGNILLADFNNHKLKLIDSRTYKVNSSLKLNDAPRAVCQAYSTVAIVCLNNHRIRLISIRGNELVPIASRNMTHECRCVAVLKDRMYVGAEKSVYVYTLRGKHVNTIENKSGIFSLFSDTIFSDIRDITVSDYTRMIHVVDWNNGVITLNTAGDVVWRYSGSELSRAHGVITDGTGNVIICGHLSNNVIQLTPDGKHIGEIVTRSEGLDNPCTLCYDRDNHKLVVGELKNSITVFTIQ